MNWMYSSLIMFASSVVLYLVVRKSSLLKFPTQFNNLAMFLIPLLIYTFIGFSERLNYTISLSNFLIILVAAIVFSYLGNFSSLKSIEMAPNPGYSLVISKSYVVFTTIVSVLFLGGEINLRKVLAILLIVIFSALVTIDPKKTKDKAKSEWIWYTLFSFFAWGLLSLTVKYLSLHGLKTIVILNYMYLFVSLLIFAETITKRIKYRYNLNFGIMFISIGIFSALFNYFNFYSVGVAPNVGYVNAINASSISIVTVFSIILFKDEFSVRKLIGVLGVTSGLLLLLI